jgi:hypothetical protein
MSNPDKSIVNVDGLAVAFPVAILFFFITIALFQFKDNIPYFKFMLWIIFTIITLFTVSTTNMITQYISCKQINASKAFLGTLPSLGTVLLGLGVSSISYCRIPIASVFTPLIVGNNVDVTMNKSTTNINSLKSSNSKECCTPKLTLESIENRYPLITGLSYGFYLVFSILFGVVIGNGLSINC